MAGAVHPRSPVRIFGCLFCLLRVWAACAQTTTPPDADRAAPAAAAAPTTRAGQIEAERKQKATELQPDAPSHLEATLNRIEDERIVERLTCGLDGLCIKFGGLITYSGFAMGPEYVDHGLFHGAATFRTSLVGSVQQAYMADMELNMPSLADGLGFLNLYAARRSFPRVDFYGEGPNSKKTGRSDYALEDTSLQVAPGFRPFAHLRIGGTGRFLLTNVGPGRDERYISSGAQFSEATTPGIQNQTNFVQGGGYVQYDWRDNPGGPRRGGNYFAQYSTFADVGRGGYSFDRVDLEAQQYISFFNQRRVIALRGRVQATDPHTGDRVPFYLQPTLGGPDDLRGYRAFRFYDNASVVMNAEYRWEVFSGLDMALFADAGQVFDRWEQINLRHLRADAGFGFRFNVRNDVFMRIDTGFSNEGFAIWLKFNNVF